MWCLNLKTLLPAKKKVTKNVRETIPLKIFKHNATL